LSHAPAKPASGVDRPIRKKSVNCRKFGARAVIFYCAAVNLRFCHSAGERLKKSAQFPKSTDTVPKNNDTRMA
jgi:hypothetical protein